MSFNEAARYSYEGHLKWLMIEASTVKKAEQEAEARGIEKGRAEGKVEGLAEGEARALERTAIKMLQQSLDETLIKQVTGLSTDQLLRLKSNH